jgi:lipid II:glycine glycyltransferase (peptidoglycan interpeptide bridge formation enzyme)
MRLSELTESEYAGITEASRYSWDDFLQSAAWGAFQKSIGREVKYFVVRDDAEKIVLSTLLIVNLVAGKCYVFAPFGPVFAQGISDADEQLEIFKFFTAQLKLFIPNLIFLRFEPANGFFPEKLTAKFGRIVKSTDLNPHQTLLLDLRQDEQSILAEMKAKTRYNIKVAQKEGVDVKVLSLVPKSVTGGLDPFYASANRAGVSTYSREYFTKLLNFFSEDKNTGNKNAITARCYAAYHQGDLLAANIMLEYKQRSIYLFGGALDLKRNTMPSYLLHWQAMLDAKSRGCETYDFWGVETYEKHPWYGFSKFKLGFGGVIEKRPGTYDLVYKPAWYTIYGILRKLNRLKILRKSR